MANAKARNVIFVDTTAASFPENLTIRSIKYIGNASGTLNIKEKDTNGQVVWEESGSSNVWNPDVWLKLPQGCLVTLTNGAKAYLYLV